MRWPPSQLATLSPFAMASPPICSISCDDLFGRRAVAAGAVGVATEVVDDDLRTFRGEQQRVLAADAAPGTRDDRDASVESPHEPTPLTQCHSVCGAH